MPRIVVIMGPTASGKSALALRYAEHLLEQGQRPAIISMDSAQVYRAMDIGTAKPSAQEQARVPHHLIDLVEPTESYSAARFASDARHTLEQLVRTGQHPIVVGGTMLYARAWLFGLNELPEVPHAVREAVAEQASREGWPALHAELTRIDPKRAAQLQPSDAQRIGRALELWRASGRTMSWWLDQPAPALTHGIPRDWQLISVEPRDRAWLHARIARRFDTMLEAGLIDELAQLRQRYALARDCPAMRCVGYRQTWSYLEGEIDRGMLRETGIAATRQLAKRQLTWLRATPRAVIDAQSDVESQLARLLGLENNSRDGE